MLSNGPASRRQRRAEESDRDDPRATPNWDTRDLAKPWDETEAAEFEVDPRSTATYNVYLC